MRKYFCLLYFTLLPLFSFPQPLLTIPFTSHPPKIDGKLSPDEWKNSSIISLFTPLGTRKLSPIPTTFYLLYDERNLYIAFSCQSPSKPKAQMRQRDGNVWEDDAVEVFLSPVFPKYFQFIVNAKNCIWDSEGKDGKWNGEWQHAVSITGNGWEGEEK
jgi:hypothetical protein